MSKSAIFGFKIASEAMQIKIPGAVLSVSVVWTRDYVRLKALMLENILNTHIMDVRPIENFLQAPEPRGVTVFGPYRQNLEISRRQKSQFWGSK